MRMKTTHHLVALALFSGAVTGLLQPQESETREVKDLSGMWRFRADYSQTRDQGFKEEWWKYPLSKTGEVIPMPVPSSYNDITTESKLRDFSGWVWYETDFFVSSDWLFDKRVMLRFGSAHYNTHVWLNSEEVMIHIGGHLPFEHNVTNLLLKRQRNRLTVAVNNTLTPTTLPPGSILKPKDPNKYPPGYFTQDFSFDFFNYAGIHRPVLLYATPQDHVEDVVIKTSNSNNGSFAFIYYNATVSAAKYLPLVVELLDEEGNQILYDKGPLGRMSLPNPKLWWPYTMSNTSYAYLYTLQLTLKAQDGSVLDIYRQPFGIRTVNFTDTQLLINNKPFYCQGLGRHEDSDIRGKGVDLPLIARDYNLMKWLGANCFRTSHYPYAEEIMDMADKLGFVVIDESPGVGIKTENLGELSLANHKLVMQELVARDKNRPSVIMWSVANEPASSDANADHYFKEVIATTRQADDTRPVTFVIGPSDYWKEKAAQYVDVLCINHYYAWYSDMGHLEVIPYQLKYDLDQWHMKYKKAIILSEYGADTVSGLHSLPSTAFTEEFQIDFLKAYHNVFDDLRMEYLVGEMVWNFADFMTKQQPTRAYGNRKGIFTRQRQPKPAAFAIRERYQSLVRTNHTKSNDCGLV